MTDRVVQVVNESFFGKMEKAHPGVVADVKKSNAIPPADRCKRCQGTGNELYAMYRQCQACKGDGITRHNEEGEFDD